MRILVREENQTKLLKLAEELGISPTHLVNKLIQEASTK